MQYAGFWKQYINKRVITGYVMQVAAMLFAVAAYAGMDYKFGPALESAGYVLVTLLSFLVLKEKLSRKKVIGISMVVAGIVVFCL